MHAWCFMVHGITKRHEAHTHTTTAVNSGDLAGIGGGKQADKLSICTRFFLLLEGEAKRGNRIWQTWDAAHSLSVSCLTPNIYSGRSVTTDVAEAEPPRTGCPAAHS